MKKKKWRKTSKMIMMLIMTSKQNGIKFGRRNRIYKVVKAVGDVSHVANFYIAS